MKQEGNVIFCPITKEEWEAKEKQSDCIGQNVYHCLVDYKGWKWEKCVEQSLIKKGYCPIFTNEWYIDWKPCNMSIPTCPNRPYFSNEVYKYPRCFGNNLQDRADGDYEKNDEISFLLIFGILSGFIILAIIIAVLGCVWRKLLNPDAQNEPSELQELISVADEMSKEIVKENHISIGFNKLLNIEVRSIVVVGKYGNSIHCTSRLILKTFTYSKGWRSLECRYTDIPNNLEEKTVLYIYGWFGMLNDDLCSVGKVKMACLSLISTLKSTTNVKLIIGMRSDLYWKYRQGLEEVDDQSTSLFRHKIYLDTCDGRVDACYGNFFEKIKTLCTKSECTCKRLTSDMLLKGKDKVVGMPLKIRVMEKYHDLIPNYLHNLDILKVMSDHFTSIEKEEGRRNVYEWIMYICLKGNFSRSDPFDTYLVKEMSFEIQQPSFDENDSELRRYVRMKNSDKQMNVSSENAHYVFWHPFIYICAFHSLFHKDPEFVMVHCNVEAIVQLVRPRGVKISYFEVAADNNCVTLFNKRIRRCSIEEKYAQHPLVKLFTGHEEV